MRVHPEPATGHPHVHWTPRGGNRHRRVVVALFLGGGSASPLGTVGEDLGYVFSETKGRPIYIPERHLSRGAEAPPGTPADQTQAPAQARRPVQRGETT